MDTPTPTPAQAAAALREISPLLMPNTTIGVQRVLLPGFLPDDPARIRLPGCWEDTWCTPDGARVLASELLAAAETAELGIQEWLRNGPAAGQVEKGESQ